MDPSIGYCPIRDEKWSEIVVLHEMLLHFLKWLEWICLLESVLCCWIAFSKVLSSLFCEILCFGKHSFVFQHVLVFSLELWFYKPCCVSTLGGHRTFEYQTLAPSRREEKVCSFTHSGACGLLQVFSDNGFSRRLDQIIKPSPNLSCSIIYFSSTPSPYIKLLFCLNIAQHATSDRALELSWGWQHHTLQCHTWA